MHDTDFDFEPQRGIPAPLPPGETLLWQGSPNWRRLMRRPFRVTWVAAWFAVIVLYQLGSDLLNGQPLGASLPALVLTALLGLLACALLTLLAWLTARVTVYSITSERVLIRFGIALQVTMNLPFQRIASASVAESRDRPAGDIALALIAEERASWFILWPHVRPWTTSRAEPMLRALDDARTPAGILADAVARRGLAASRGTGGMDSPVADREADGTRGNRVLAS